MHQFDFANFPFIPHPLFKQILNEAFIHAPDGVGYYEWVMSFPNSSIAPNESFLFKVKQNDRAKYLVEAIYCLNELDGAPHVWAYVNSPKGIDSLLQLGSCDRAFDLTTLLEYLQNLVLEDVAANGIEYKVGKAPFWEKEEFAQVLPD
ncbi:hypothetical protein L0668_14170 [Paraglaciecola aquimarina]|uniref:Uncharacterized protein n=1 Tax=Paraglaciecola algarum TaxID=3050085 RepID=A0ABS9DA62_9ALTE|nr:hypothetical protein [Paraglaciecola sp. G1-23]MCF2949260.1 hypothetical protein [Paraglaciecola sp. G1-23]